MKGLRQSKSILLAFLICASLTLGALASSVARADESAAQRQLRHRMEALQASGRLTVDGVHITAVRLIAELYPQDYHLDPLKKLRAELATHPDVKRSSVTS